MEKTKLALALGFSLLIITGCGISKEKLAAGTQTKSKSPTIERNDDGGSLTTNPPTTSGPNTPPAAPPAPQDTCLFTDVELAQLKRDAEAAPATTISDPTGEYARRHSLSFADYRKQAYPDFDSYSAEQKAKLEKQFNDWQKGLDASIDASHREEGRAKVYAAALNKRYQCLSKLPYFPCFPDARREYPTTAGEENAPYAETGVSCVLNSSQRVYMGRSPNPNLVIKM